MNNIPKISSFSIDFNFNKKMFKISRIKNPSSVGWVGSKLNLQADFSGFLSFCGIILKTGRELERDWMIDLTEN